MTKEEIEDELLCFSEEDDDWNKVVKAFNLGLQIASKEAKITTGIKPFVGAGYTSYKSKPIIDKKSITKWKITI